MNKLPCLDKSDPDQLWRPSPPDGRLPAQEINVWRVSLEQPVECVERLSRILSTDERMRAERFHFDRERKRFIVSRGALRTILGRYLGVGPDQLRFRYGPHGKPCLSEEFDRCALGFNLAHSNDLALYAFASGRKVGIDVEHVHPIPDAEQIAARFFSKYENAVLRELPESQRLEAFFNCWTRKEAFIKAIGDGLTSSLGPISSFAGPRRTGAIAER